MWESLVAIGRGTYEIARWKKKKETITAKHNGLYLACVFSVIKT